MLLMQAVCCAVLETDEDSAHSVPPAAVACSQALPGTSGILGDAWVIDEDDLDWDTQTSKAEDTQKPEAKKTPDTQKPEAEGTQEPQAEVTEQPQAEEKQNPEDEGTQQAKAKEEQSPDDEEEQKPEDEINNPKDEKTQHNEDKEAENPYQEKIQRSLPGKLFILIWVSANRLWRHLAWILNGVLGSSWAHHPVHTSLHGLVKVQADVPM